jgi:hypothetical protein
MSERTIGVDVIRNIDEAIVRWPLRDEGVHWLKAKEWDAIKDELARLQALLKTAENLLQEAANEINHKFGAGDDETTTCYGAIVNFLDHALKAKCEGL